jgi:hypothetical protein
MLQDRPSFLVVQAGEDLFGSHARDSPVTGLDNSRSEDQPPLPCLLR